MSWTADSTLAKDVLAAWNAASSPEERARRYAAAGRHWRDCPARHRVHRAVPPRQAEPADASEAGAGRDEPETAPDDDGDDAEAPDDNDDEGGEPGVPRRTDNLRDPEAEAPAASDEGDRGEAAPEEPSAADGEDPKSQ